MEITEAAEKDLPEMITLLKASLGEKLIPKSEAFFLWKHESNPFGRSKTLLAKETGRIIGLRTFMNWHWVKGDEKIRAVRAVDTATDPAFQGRGIFKKLTLSAVGSCTADGTDMVFNTPNPVSMQGYLKMGWHIAGRMPIYAGPGSVFPGKWSHALDDELPCKLDFTEPMNFISTDYYHTPVSIPYLKWRYQECPVVRYGIHAENDFGFIFRLKPLSRFIEMRICEIWSKPGSGVHADLRKALKKYVRQFRPIIITCAPTPLLERKPLTGLFGPFKKGPVTTIRPLAKNNLDAFDSFKLWRPSMGSLELF